jgi:hypothetical protein
MYALNLLSRLPLRMSFMNPLITIYIKIIGRGPLESQSYLSRGEDYRLSKQIFSYADPGEDQGVFQDMEHDQ